MSIFRFRPWSVAPALLFFCALLLPSFRLTASESLQLLGELGLGPSVAVAVDADRRLCFDTSGSYVRVSSVSADGHLQHMGQLRVSAPIRQLALAPDQQQVYLALGTAGFQAVDYSQPTALRLVSLGDAALSEVLAVCVVGQVLAVADRQGPTRLYATSDLRFLGQTSTGQAHALAAAGSRLVEVASYSAQLWDLSQPGSPQALGRAEPPASDGQGETGRETYLQCAASSDLLAIGVHEWNGNGHTFVAFAVQTWRIDSSGQLAKHARLVAGNPPVNGLAIQQRSVLVTAKDGSWTLRSYKADPASDGRSWDWALALGRRQAHVVASLGELALVATDGSGLISVDGNKRSQVDAIPALESSDLTGALGPDRAWLAAGPELLLVDISVPGAPTVLDRLSIGYSAYAASSAGQRLALASNSFLTLVEMNNDRLQWVAQAELAPSLDQIQAVWLGAQHVYCGFRDSGLGVVPWSTNPSVARFNDLGLFSPGIEALIDGPSGVLYAVVTDYGVVALDLSDPAAPVAQPFSGARKSFLGGDWSAEAGLLVFSSLGISRYQLSNPLSPGEATRILDRNTIASLQLDGDRVLIAAKSAGISSYRIRGNTLSNEVSSTIPQAALWLAPAHPLLLLADAERGLCLYRQGQLQSRRIQISRPQGRTWSVSPAAVTETSNASSQSFWLSDSGQNYLLQILDANQ